MSRSLAKCEIYMEVWAMRRSRGSWREAKKMRVKEERRNLAKAVLITENMRKKDIGEAKAEEIIRKFRDGCVYITDEKLT